MGELVIKLLKTLFSITHFIFLALFFSRHYIFIMARVKYIPNSSLYDQYYAGKGIDRVYRGSIIQRGYGIGSIISSLFRSGLPIAKKILFPLIKRNAIPLIKKAGKNLAENALKSGTNSIINALTKKPKKSRAKNPNSLTKQNKNHLKRKLAEAGTIRGKGKPGTGKKRKRKIEDKYMDIFGN